MSVSIGIDLGTTFSAVAYIPKGETFPKIITNSEGSRLTPSVIFFENGKIIFGSEAEDAYNSGEINCVATFKRNMGSDETFCYINGKEYTSEQLSTLLLKHLKEDAERVLNDRVEEAVITVPAYFDTLPREATLRAAEAAGLKVKKLIDEPNAAALAYGAGHWRENANILVYDLGGGTFDVTLVHMGSNGELSTVVTRGNHKLGGRDWDARIKDIVFSKIEEETGESLRDNKEYDLLVSGLTEDIKKDLSQLQTTKTVLKFPETGRITISISRSEFENASYDLLDMTGALCKAVLEEAGITETDITDILLVGGSTRMPQVGDYLQKTFGRKPLSHINPDEAVALGAAIQATKANDKYVKSMVTTDEMGRKITDRSSFNITKSAPVCTERRISDLSLISLRETTAHAMGVISINDNKNCYYNEIIIPANHPRPVSLAKRFRFITSPNGSNELEIYVLQGSDDDPIKCLIPYKYIVSGIRHVPEGETLGTIIRIQYSYDGNGIIHIQARQEDDNYDLPIKKDTSIVDKSVFASPVGKEQKGDKNGLALRSLGSIVHKYRSVTFSNAEWVKYDNVSFHSPAPQYNEPSQHIIANEKNIEFHGYNISQMDEGVYYIVQSGDNFEIECDIDTSKISPHPGGCLNIKLGIITASINENGGSILLDEQSVCTVGSKFKLKMALNSGNNYEVWIDDKSVGKAEKDLQEEIKVVFGFVHGSHDCHMLSHAYISDIKMKESTEEDDSIEVDTWEVK